MRFLTSAPYKISVCTLCEGDVSGGDKSKKGVKRKKIAEESGETAKRRSARVRNTKCKKEEKVDFQELLMKFLPSRYYADVFSFAKISKHISLQPVPPIKFFLPLPPPPLASLLCPHDICADSQSTDVTGLGSWVLLTSLPSELPESGAMTCTSFGGPHAPWALRRWMDHRATGYSPMSSCTHRHPLAGRPRATAAGVQTLGNPTEGSTHSALGKSMCAWFLQAQ